MSHFATAGRWDSIVPPLSDRTLTALQALKFEQMTPVQAQCVPLFARNKDVVVEALTGSGKTLAFLIPIIERLLSSTQLKKNEIGALVISPTRELATQTYDVLRHFVAHCCEESSDEDDDIQLNSIKPCNQDNGAQKIIIDKDVNAYPTCNLLLGGSNTSVDEDIARFRKYGANIIIGTPGRIEEFLRRGIGARSASSAGMIISTKAFEMLVLDEADRLLDLGFTSSLTAILDYLPKQRRTGLFSATMTEGVSQLVRAGLRNPVRIVVKVEDTRNGAIWRTPQTLDIRWVEVEAEHKAILLLRTLRAATTSKTIVFFATCKSAEYWFQHDQLFQRHGELCTPPVHCLHGQQTTKRRTNVYRSFVTAAAPSILFTTDLAARGLDIPDIAQIIQFDAPTDSKMFAHRCGRAGRQGQIGKAVVFLCKNEATYVDFLRLRKVNIAESKTDICDSVSLQKDAVTLRQQFQELLKHDRALCEYAILAFTSSIRAYMAHELSYIFRLKQIDLLGMLKSFSLISLPSMPELKTSSAIGDIKAYFDSLNVNLALIPYQDKEREKARLMKIAKQVIVLRQPKSKTVLKNSIPWSKQTAQKERRELRRTNKVKRKLGELQRSSEIIELPPGSVVAVNDPKIDVCEREKEWDELADEERKVKRPKYKSRICMRFSDLDNGN